MESYKSIFDKILKANKEESRRAARGLRKYFYSSHRDRDGSENINDYINSAPEVFCNISEDWRQENFVVAISVIYYCHDRESEPDFLFPWLFYLLSHKNGNIRFAAVRMIGNELGPLSYHLRFPGERLPAARLSPAEADRILLSMFVSLHNLLSTHWEPKYDRYKYVESLPSGAYKSAQMVLRDLEEYCGRKYIKKMEKLLF